jgi:hypothetical protein
MQLKGTYNRMQRLYEVISKLVTWNIYPVAVPQSKEAVEGNGNGRKKGKRGPWLFIVN